MLNTGRHAGIIIFFILLSCFIQTNSQVVNASEKGKFFFYWGWNRDTYTNSDIHFKGTGYNFTLYDVVSTDKQSKFKVNTYLNPLNATVPQYNARLGYNITEHYNVSLGDDHMKYLMTQNQVVKISGEIATPNTPDFNKTYDLSSIKLTENFLMLQHCDGLNYLNIELRRFDQLLFFKKKILKEIIITSNEGIGIGVMMPRTKAVLFNNMPRHEFHFAGYASAAIAALKIQFGKHVFIQGEIKGGFINMPSIFTTMDKGDRASQHFFFTQRNINFGWSFR